MYKPPGENALLESLLILPKVFFFHIRSTLCLQVIVSLIAGLISVTYSYSFISAFDTTGTGDSFNTLHKHLWGAHSNRPLYGNEPLL